MSLLCHFIPPPKTTSLRRCLRVFAEFRNHTFHITVEERHCKIIIAVIWTVDHSLAD